MVDVGVMFRCPKPPETLRGFVQVTENAGYDELWIVEDCFWAGGVSSVGTALAWSETIKIGLGIVPAVLRNPALTAMEFAMLARTFPNRFLPGIGHGVAAWMKQIGAFPKSQLAALEETALVVRALMRGETINMTGEHLYMDDVQLVFPPDDVPPVQLGVRSIKSLQLSGRSADGTILAEGVNPAYMQWAREQIAIGQEQSDREAHHRITVYVWASIDDDKQSARARIRPVIARALPYSKVYLEPMGVWDDLQSLINQHGNHVADALPDEWLDMLTVSGTVDDCLASVQRFVEAGADSIVLVCSEPDELAQVQRFAEVILPMVRNVP